jgi:hypothetical protein
MTRPARPQLYSLYDRPYFPCGAREVFSATHTDGIADCAAPNAGNRLSACRTDGETEFKTKRNKAVADR